jgi:hypothetical protein
LIAGHLRRHWRHRSLRIVISGLPEGIGAAVVVRAGVIGCNIGGAIILPAKHERRSGPNQCPSQPGNYGRSTQIATAHTAALRLKAHTSANYRLRNVHSPSLRIIRAAPRNADDVQLYPWKSQTELNA